MPKHPPLKVYQTGTHPQGASTVPVYIIEDGKFYHTVDHIKGWSELPDYKLKSDGLIYRTKFHPLGISETPAYRFQKDGLLYETSDHLKGVAILPMYEIKD